MGRQLDAAGLAAERLPGLRHAGNAEPLSRPADHLVLPQDLGGNGLRHFLTFGQPRLVLLADGLDPLGILSLQPLELGLQRSQLLLERVDLGLEAFHLLDQGHGELGELVDPGRELLDAVFVLGRFPGTAGLELLFLRLAPFLGQVLELEVVAFVLLLNAPQTLLELGELVDAMLPSRPQLGELGGYPFHLLLQPVELEVFFLQLIQLGEGGRNVHVPYLNASRFIVTGMGIRPDRWIREMAKKGMIDPFEEHLVREGVISYGLSSFGYDLRAAPEWKVFTDVYGAVVDPKRFDERAFVTIEAEEVLIPPNSFALTRSIEYIRMPENVLGIALGKSTYARCGIVVNVTPLEPGWEGHVTLEISNTTPLPAKVYAGEGIVQIIFLESDRPETTYADRRGKYQGQRGVTLPKV